MDKLIFYDYTTNEEVGFYLDLGTCAPRSSGDQALRLFNPNTTYQADDVIVTVVNKENGDQLWLSLDGDTFTDHIDVGAIAPSNMSLAFFIRRVTPSTQTNGPCTAELSASPTAWVSASDSGTSDNLPLPTPDDPQPIT